MDNHFSHFRVQNFKCFDDLTLDNLGLINIIVGDNNVGKTSLLEALLFTEENGFEILLSRWSYILQSIKKLGSISENYMTYYTNRNIQNWEEYNTIEFELKNDKYNYLCSFHIEKKQNKHIMLKDVENQDFINHTLTEFPATKNSNNLRMPYVHFHQGHGNDLVDIYSKEIQLIEHRRKEFMNGLKMLIPNLSFVEPHKLHADNKFTIVIGQEGLATLPLAVFGEGAIKLFRLLMEIIEWSHQRLMIDEIETGMHHSRMIPFWQAVLNTAYSQDTQLFATTHSLECLQKLHEVLEKPENEHLREKVRIIKLANTAKKGIQAYIYPYENFEYSLENDIEIR